MQNWLRYLHDIARIVKESTACVSIGIQSVIECDGCPFDRNRVNHITSSTCLGFS